MARRIWWSGSKLRDAAAIWRRTSLGSGSSSFDGSCATGIGSTVGLPPWAPLVAISTAPSGGRLGGAAGSACETSSGPFADFWSAAARFGAGPLRLARPPAALGREKRIRELATAPRPLNGDENEGEGEPNVC